jgi:hypothetical protein
VLSVQISVKAFGRLHLPRVTTHPMHEIKGMEEGKTEEMDQLVSIGQVNQQPNYYIA